MRKKMNFGVLASAAGLTLLSAAALLTSCAREEAGGDPDGVVTMSVKASVSGYSGLSATRSDYDRINDVEAVNVVRYAIYTGGSLVDHNETGEFRVSARKRYDLYAIANVSGWSYPSSEEALRRQTMPAPAISSFATAGIPLAGCAEDVKPGDHNFTSEIPLKRLFSLVRLDLTPPAGATVSDVIINAFYVTNQNAVLTPFGESFYAEGVSGCAKAADDATDGHAYRDEVPAELTKGRYFVYVPENCSFVSGRTITPSGFYLRGSYALDGVKRTVDATTLIATGADATSALVSGQCRRNALVTVSLYDLSSAAEEPWLEVDPASLTDTMYVAEASSTFRAVVHNYAGGLTVSSSDNIRVLNAADGGLFADNGDGTATLSLRYGCLAEGDGTGTISVMKAGSAIRDGVISMRTKAPTLKFDKASYPLTNAARTQAVSLTYRMGDGSVYRSYDQALYDELLDVRTEVAGKAKNLVRFIPTQVSLNVGANIDESNAGTYPDALVARPAASGCGVAAAKAAVRLENPQPSLKPIWLGLGFVSDVPDFYLNFESYNNDFHYTIDGKEYVADGGYASGSEEIADFMASWFYDDVSVANDNTTEIFPVQTPLKAKSLSDVAVVLKEHAASFTLGSSFALATELDCVNGGEYGLDGDVLYSDLDKGSFYYYTLSGERKCFITEYEDRFEVVPIFRQDEQGGGAGGDEVSFALKNVAFVYDKGEAASAGEDGNQFYKSVFHVEVRISGAPDVNKGLSFKVWVTDDPAASDIATETPILLGDLGTVKSLIGSSPAGSYDVGEWISGDVLSINRDYLPLNDETYSESLSVTMQVIYDGKTYAVCEGVVPKLGYVSGGNWVYVNWR